MTHNNSMNHLRWFGRWHDSGSTNDEEYPIIEDLFSIDDYSILKLVPNGPSIT